jgi:transposase
MDRKVYPSDISREQFEVIRDLFERARHKTAPRRNDLYDVFSAMLYLLKSGCSKTFRLATSGLPIALCSETYEPAVNHK